MTMNYQNEASPLLSTLKEIKTDQTKDLKRHNSILLLALIATLGPLLLLYLKHHPGGVLRLLPLPMLGSMDASIQQRPRRHGARPAIRPGAIFLDTSGIPINAHGGGFLRHNGTYYWYGEIKSGPTYLPASNAGWGGTRVDLAGISCYASRDLLRWEHRGTALPAVRDDPGHDLYVDNVAERPKVAYNARTATFVMWLHVDGADYRRARCGVATSARPEGPFAYRGSFWPHGQMARDLTVLVDDDPRATAYLFTSSEDNAALHISRLRSDYLAVTGSYSRALVGRYTEAPAVFKHRGAYHLVGSGCTAWRPNAARSATAPAPLGPWTERGNPCQGKGANLTFHAQAAGVLPLGGDRFLFAADRWDETNLSDSRYVWLPLTFEGGSERPVIRWYDEWRPELPEDAAPPPHK